MGTTSLKLPDELKSRAAAVAKARGVTPHAFMLQAVEQVTTAAELRARFVEDALTARREIAATGLSYDWAEVRDYYRAKLRGERARRPRLRKW